MRLLKSFEPKQQEFLKKLYSSEKPFLAISVPCYHTSHRIFAVVEAIEEQVKKISSYYKIILVDDCSTDDTWQCIQEIKAEKKDKVHAIRLRKNCGEHNAQKIALGSLEAGIFILVDDDLQQNPCDFQILINEILRGKDLVYGKYERKKHSRLRNQLSKFNETAATITLKKPKGLYLSSFKAIRGSLAKELQHFPSPHLYLDAVLLSLTSNYSQVTVSHSLSMRPSTYTASKLVGLHLNMLLGFSTTPMKYIATGTLLFYALALFLDFILKSTGLTLAIFVWGAAVLFHLSLMNIFLSKILQIRQSLPATSYIQEIL